MYAGGPGLAPLHPLRKAARVSLVDPRVRAGWLAFNAPFEGRIDTLYQDTKGLVTTSVGILCDSVQACQAMTWTRRDGSTASPVEVAAEFHRVKALPPALVWTRYQSPVGLHLGPDELERVVLERLDADAVELARTFPAFASYPPPAQQALLSMAWAMGAGFPRTWPHLAASVRAEDWAACAANCEINAVGNPGVIPRSRAQQQLFLAAAGWDPTATLPTGAQAVDSGAAAT